MQCEKFERRLHHLLDRRERPDDDAQLWSHAADCHRCLERLAAQDALWVGLAQLEAPQLSVDFAMEVVRLAVQPQPRSSEETISDRPVHAATGRPTKRRRAWSLAAAVLLVISPAFFWATRAKEPRNDDATAGTPAGVVPLANDENRGRTAPVSEATETPRGIAYAAGGPAAPDRPAREEHYAQVFERWRTQLPQWGDTLGLTDENAPTVQGAAALTQITHRLRTPLSASIESTLNVLRTALPSAAAEQNPSKPQARVWRFADFAAVG